MGRRRRGLVALGVLGAAIAQCTALEPPRRLISFDEAHSIAAEAEETATGAVNSLVSAVTSSVLGRASRAETDDTTTTSPPTTSPVSITITIGGSETAEESVSDEDSKETTETPSPTVSAQGSDDGESYASTNAPVTAAPSTVSTAVSRTKRPTTRSPAVVVTTPRTTPSTSTDDADGTGAESEATAPTAAPTPTTLVSTPTTVVTTQAPTTSVATDAPVVSVLTETPAAVVATTAPTTLLPNVSSMPTATTATGPTTESGVVDDDTEAPATDASSSTDAVVILPDESTVIPLETTAAPAPETTSADGSSGTAVQVVGVSATWSPSSVSSGSNDTVLPVDGSEGTSQGSTPGQVHASSSVAESSDGSSDASDTGSLAFSKHDGHKKKDKKKKESPGSSSNDASRSAGSSSNGKSTSASSIDSGSSGRGGNGIGAILNPGGVSDVNTSSATYYSLGTGSIVAIVGVIAGVMGILVLFVAIGRKKYTDEDDESPLPYGYNMDIRSVPRLSPTFMQEDSFMESGFNINNTALMVPVSNSCQFDGTSSSGGESADEVPSLRVNLMVANTQDISIRSRVPSVHSFNGDATGVRMSSLYSGSSLTSGSGSGISGSWSSVLASDTERQPSRNTRDTSLSAWSVANLSSFGSTASGGSAYRMTRSSSTLSTELRRTGGSDHQDHATDPPSTYPATTDVESNRSNKSTEV